MFKVVLGWWNPKRCLKSSIVYWLMSSSSKKSLSHINYGIPFCIPIHPSFIFGKFSSTSGMFFLQRQAFGLPSNPLLLLLLPLPAF
jgi:hypothetical protein